MTTDTQSNIQISSSPLHVPVDTEHIGIRTMMPILTISGLVGGFLFGRFVAPLLFPSLGSLCFSIIFAVLGLVILTTVGEQIIKPLWRSGRHFEVSTDALEVIDTRSGQTGDMTFQWAHAINVRAWYFEVPTRKSRVPPGWLCTSVLLSQNDRELVIYTFISPDDATQLPKFQEWFFHLLPRKQREELTAVDPRAAARQQRYRKLEGVRQFNGAEVTPEHFAAMMVLIAEHGVVGQATTAETN